MSNEPIYKQVIRDMEARAEVGKATYGRYLMNDVNGRDPVQDAYEEALDMAKYLKQTSHERRALLEYVARLEGAARKILTTGENGESLWWHEIDETLRNTLATSPLAGQPNPAPATGWRPIAEAEDGAYLDLVLKPCKTARGGWYFQYGYLKRAAVEDGFTLYQMLPPKEGE